MRNERQQVEVRETEGEVVGTKPRVGITNERLRKGIWLILEPDLKGYLESLERKREV